MFGRGGEEADALREAGVAYEVVPGVTSAISVPAYAGVPVTHRDLAAQVTIVTGHERPGKPTLGRRLGCARANCRARSSYSWAWRVWLGSRPR